MRLTSITVRNYRIHHELQVTLDPAITLIGGPNESGKSTLIEAVHRALFLKATCGGEAQKSMVPKHGGCPEVEVAFETGGRSYRVTKRFSGANGQASLIQIGGVMLNGDPAAAKLAELFGVEPAGGVRNVLERVKEQWAHIWAWQGEAGKDPTEHSGSQSKGFINSRSDDLIRQLQAKGGAVVLQSALDASAAERFAAFVQDTFTNKGNPKADSELGKSAGALVEAESKEQQARSVFGALEQAMLDCDDAEEEIARIEKIMPGLKTEAASVGEKLKFADRLRAKGQIREQKLQRCKTEHQQLADVDSKIGGLLCSISAAEASLGPKNETTHRLQEILDHCTKEVEEAQRALGEAGEAAGTKRAGRDLAQAFVTSFEKQDALAKLKALQQKIQDEREKLQVLRSNIAMLPVILEKDLRTLRKRAQEVSDANIALEAMATGIDILATDLAVHISGDSLVAGDSRTVNENTEIEIGAGVRLRIRPGGGTSLADARIRKNSAETELRAFLAKLGVESIAKAEEVVRERDRITAAIKVIEAALQLLGTDTIDEDLAKAQHDSAGAQAEVDRRSSGNPGFLPPADLSAAQTLHASTREEADAAERIETDERRKMERVNIELKSADKALREHRTAIQQEQAALVSLRAELAVLLNTHGDDEMRAPKLFRLLRRKLRAEKLVAHTKSKLAKLQPEVLAAGREQLDGAIEGQKLNLREAQDKRLGAKNSLQSHGTANPAADLANAQLSAGRIRERHALEKRRAEANKRLHDLFTEEQRSLAERFTQPLAEKISGYIQCLFGPEARINLESDGRAFQKMSVIRPVDGGGEMEFDLLSGGAREQVAAAVRLAVAEILAADYDGTLPVVFDDAFAYSDPERVKGVQRMLFQASRRGLQVIVLACNPSDYSGLGGTTKILPKPAVQKMVPSPARHSEPTKTPEAESVVPDSETSENTAKPLPKSAVQRASSLPSHHPEPTEVFDAEQDGAASGIEVPAAEMEDRRQRFLNALRAAFGGSAGNIRFREHLGWDLATYEAVRGDLVFAGKLVKGQGQGGTVRIP